MYFAAISTTALCTAFHAPSPVPSPATCPACGAEPRLDGRHVLLAGICHGAVGTRYRALAPDGANVGQHAHVLFDPAAPKRCVLFPLNGESVTAVHGLHIGTCQSGPWTAPSTRSLTRVAV
jgi:hypothetical protein